MATDQKHTRAGATTALLLAGAVSAGVHAGLVPEHLHEWPLLGAAFVVAAAGVAAATAAHVIRPLSSWPPRVLGALFAGIVAAYVLTRLAAVPLLDPEQEPLDLLGATTTAVEAAGLAVAIRRGRSTTTTGGTA